MKEYIFNVDSKFSIINPSDHYLKSKTTIKIENDIFNINSNTKKRDYIYRLKEDKQYINKTFKINEITSIKIQFGKICKYFFISWIACLFIFILRKYEFPNPPSMIDIFIIHNFITLLIFILNKTLHIPNVNIQINAKDNFSIKFPANAGILAYQLKNFLQYINNLNPNIKIKNNYIFFDILVFFIILIEIVLIYMRINNFIF